MTPDKTKSNILGGVLIDAQRGEVRAVEVPRGLKGLYDAIGCTDINAVTLTHWPQGFPRETLWVDGEGLINGTAPAFLFAGAPQPYMGNGLILSCDLEGESQSTEVQPSTVAAKVFFTNRPELVAAINRNRFLTTADEFRRAITLMRAEQRVAPDA